MPGWMRFLDQANPWVVVIGGLLLFFLIRDLVHRAILFLAQHMVVGFKAIWDYLTGRAS